MLTLLRWVGGFLLTIALLILLAVIIIPRVVDPNDYRDEITELVKEQTGRELALNGDLSISVFPWLGVETQSLSLSQPDSIGGQMLAVDKAQLRVKFMPLLSKRIEVDTIVLDSPQVNLITLKNGVSSMDGLTGEDDASDESIEAEEAAVALVIAGVSVNNANVVIDNRQEASRIEIKNLNLESGNLLGESFAPLELSGEMHDAESPEPMLFEAQGQARIDKDTTAVYLQGMQTKVEKGVLNARLDIADLSFLETSKLSLADVDIALSGDYPVQASIPAVAMNLDSETVNIETLSASFNDAKATISQLDIKGFEDPKISASVDVAPFNARKLIRQFEIDYQPQSASVLTAVGVNAKLQAGLDQAKFTDLNLQLDGSTLTGSASVRNFEKPAATFDLKLSDLVLDDYLPPSDEESEEEQVSGAEALVLPLAAFKELNANGRFTANSLTSGGIKMDDIDVRVRSTQGSVTITPSASLYDGKLDGNIAFTESGDSVLKVEQNVDLVDLGRMLTDADISEQLRGLGSLAIDVLVRESNGVQTNQGTIKLQASKGEISGVDMNSILQRANNVMSLLGNKGESANEADASVQGEADEQGITKFAEMSGTFNLNNFVLSNDDFELIAPAFKVTGEGVIDVAKQSVNYLIEVAVAENIDGVLGQQLDKIKGQQIPVRCKGALDAPICLPDAKKLYSNFVAARLDAKKGEYLEEKFGIQEGENLSTKDVLKQVLINKALGKDKEPQERDLRERDAQDRSLEEGSERSIREKSDQAQPSRDQSDRERPVQERDNEAEPEEEDVKDQLKRKLLEKLFD